MRTGEVVMTLKSLKWTVCLGVALAPWLLAVPAPAADEVFSVTKIISLPANSPGPNQPGSANQALASFDIEFVDPIAGVFLLADRSNKSIDVASTSTNLIIGELQPVYSSATPPTFAGAIPAASCPIRCRCGAPTAPGPMGC